MNYSYYPHIKILYRTFLGVNYAIYNKHQAGITLIVKSTTLLFGDGYPVSLTLPRLIFVFYAADFIFVIIESY